MRRVVRFLIFISSVFLFACSADHKNVRSEQSFGGEAQGTSYTVKYIGLEQAKLPTAVDSLLNAIDASMSTYVESSTISKLNNGDSAIIEPIFMEVFLLSKKINSETDGAFDPTLAPIIEAWGFDFAEAKSMDTNKINELAEDYINWVLTNGIDPSEETPDINKCRNDPEAEGCETELTTSCNIPDIGWLLCPVLRTGANLADSAYGYLSENFLEVV